MKREIEHTNGIRGDCPRGFYFAIQIYMPPNRAEKARGIVSKRGADPRPKIIFSAFLGPGFIQNLDTFFSEKRPNRPRKRPHFFIPYGKGKKGGDF